MVMERIISATLALSAVGCTQALQERDMSSEVDVTIATTVYTTLCPVSTYVAPGGQTVIASGSAVIIDETNTIIVPTVTSETVLITDGVTITISPQIVDPVTTVINGQTVVSSSSGVVIGGTDMVELPPVSSQSELVTDGITFTLLPQTTDPETTVTNGQTILSSAGGAIIGGTDTVAFPPVSSPSELATDGIAFTLIPSATNLPTSTDGRTDQLTRDSTGTTLVPTTGGVTAITTEITTEITTGSDGKPTSLTKFNTISSIPVIDSGTTSLPIATATTGVDGLPTPVSDTTALPISTPGATQAASEIILTTITTVTTGADGFTTPNLITTAFTAPPATDTLLATMTTVTTGADGFTTPNIITTEITAPPAIDTLLTTINTVTTGADGFTTPNIITTVITAPPATGTFIATMTTIITGADGLTIPSVVTTITTASPAATGGLSSTPTDYPGITFVIPTTTILPGAEETSHALEAVPILFWLHENIDLIEDDRYRIWFIDRIKESRDDIVGLFNSFTDKPDPKSECNKTSMKRGLLDGIFGLFKGVADLIGCATQVMDNLVTTTNDLTNLPMGEIRLLTDTLHDIGNEIDKKKNDPTGTATQASETGTSTASSSISCTTSLTVTWESVFCTVTTTADEVTAGAEETAINELERRDEGCSTTAYSVVTDCSATASTATTTTTVTETPTVTPLTSCDQDNCGGDSCGVRARGVLSRRSVPRKTEPATCKWAEKSNYENPADFMANEVKLAVDDKKAVSLNKLFTSKLVPFQDRPVSVAVTGLFGCTSIIAVSRRGVWASHIYETPVFRPKSGSTIVRDAEGKEVIDPATGQPKKRAVFMNQSTRRWEYKLNVNKQLEYFAENCLAPIQASDGAGAEYGLGDCRKATQSENAYWQGHVFDDDSDTRIFLVAPLERAINSNDPNYGVENPTGLNLMWDSADTTNRWGFIRADWGRGSGSSYNAQIRAQITSIFDGNVPISTIPYAPPEGTTEEKQDTQFNSNRGKVLIQYQPAVTSDKDSKASWRVWFEGHDDNVQTSSWDPLPARGDPSKDGVAQQKCVDVCEINARDSSSKACSPDSASSSVADPSTTIQTASSTATAAPTPTGCRADSDCQNGMMAGSCPAAQPPVCRDSKCVCRPDTPPTHTEPTTTTTSTTEMPTTTAPAQAMETANITPLGQKSSLHCWDESTFPGHGDVQGSGVSYWAEDFCTEDRNRLQVLYSDFSKDHVYSTRQTDTHGINYDFKVEWASKCQTSQNSQSIPYPSDPNGAANGDSCTSLLRGVYTDCKNGGIGGEIQVGCLVYSFVGAKG